MLRSILSRSSAFSVALLVAGVTAAACSENTITKAAHEGDAGVAEGDPQQEDAGAEGADAAKPTRPTSVGQTCDALKPCSEGQKCASMSRTGGLAICLNACPTGTCAGGEECSSGDGLCYPTCSQNLDGTQGFCPRAMQCSGTGWSPSRDSFCYFDCNLNRFLCGAGEVCSSDGHSCNPPPKDPCTAPTTAASSGVAGTKTIGALTDGERATFCDWQAGRAGGYACTHKCEGGLSTSNKASQVECKAAMKATCPATVAQAEACALIIAQNPCDLGAALGETCQPLFQAGCK